MTDKANHQGRVPELAKLISAALDQYEKENGKIMMWEIFGAMEYIKFDFSMAIAERLIKDNPGSREFNFKDFGGSDGKN